MRAQSPAHDKSNGQVALVTAGAGGIGLTIARHLRGEGFTVHVCDIDASGIERFKAANPGATASVTDVADCAQVDDLFAGLEQRHGRLDVVINNAGVAGPTAPVENIQPEDWDQTIAVCLNGAFYVTRKAVPLLKKQSAGSIVNIASSAAFFGFPLRSPYAAAKWALVGLTKTLAMELGPCGIRVNAICPGSVSGPRIEAVIERDARRRGRSVDEIRAIWTRQTSLRTFVDAQDVAEMVGFLVSPAGARISGQAIGVDGHTESLSSPLD